MGESRLPRSDGGCLEVGLPEPTLLPLGPGSVILTRGRENERIRDTKEFKQTLKELQKMTEKV